MGRRPPDGRPSDGERERPRETDTPSGNGRSGRSRRSGTAACSWGAGRPCERGHGLTRTQTGPWEKRNNPLQTRTQSRSRHAHFRCHRVGGVIPLDAGPCPPRTLCSLKLERQQTPNRLPGPPDSIVRGKSTRRHVTCTATQNTRRGRPHGAQVCGHFHTDRVSHRVAWAPEDTQQEPRVPGGPQAPATTLHPRR